MKSKRSWVNLMGGFVALLGFFLPFDGVRSLFHILENTPIPFFSPLLVLLVALAMVLYGLDYPGAASLLGLALFLGWLFLLCLLLRTYSFAGLAENLSLWACVLPIGLLAMALYPA